MLAGGWGGICNLGFIVVLSVLGGICNLGFIVVLNYRAWGDL